MYVINLLLQVVIFILPVAYYGGQLVERVDYIVSSIYKIESIINTQSNELRSLVVEVELLKSQIRAQAQDIENLRRQVKPLPNG